jgi:hypothetical protein
MPGLRPASLPVCGRVVLVHTHTHTNAFEYKYTHTGQVLLCDWNNIRIPPATTHLGSIEVSSRYAHKVAGFLTKPMGLSETFLHSDAPKPGVLKYEP